MPLHTEPNANNALGDLLRTMMPGSRVLSENTQTFPAHPGRHADVLVTTPGRSPVVVEAEYDPAPEAEQDAADRLGLAVAGESRTIESAIALRYPVSVRDSYDVDQAVANARLSYCVLYEDETRFPESGWLKGSVTDLVDLVRLVSVPQKEVDLAADTLQDGIEKAAVILDELKDQAPATAREIARLLGMSDVPQTRRMACAIIANALVFHERIAGKHDGVKPLNLVCGPDVANPQAETLAAWSIILNINYWPIFAIARDILGQLDSGRASQVLAVLGDTAQKVQSAGVTQAHDLTGRIFQRLIADRKYLATFYTRPESAALLARLAVAKLQGVDWADAGAIGSLRIGDFACGTGALLSAVYDQVAARHERSGGDLAALHPTMLEEVLYGCDVMPSAAHITSATLSGVQPDVIFNKSRIYTMPYGRQSDGTVSIGSLELLQSSQLLTLFNTNDPALRTGSVGEETAAQINVDIPDSTFDIVIMNPPFTRAGSDWEGTERDEDYIKQFRGLSTALDTQKEMANRLSLHTKGTCYHGYAGIASAFTALADKKLKPGGVLALVLPLSAAAGLSWQGFRQMLAGGYSELMVLSLGAAEDDELSFSADTGMAECLVIARKKTTEHPLLTRTHFTSLRRRPQGFADASAIATYITNAGYVRQIEDGPYGGTPVFIGDGISGDMVTTDAGQDGDGWAAVRLQDYSCAQSAHSLALSKLWLPGFSEASDLQVASLDSVGKRGWYHINIAGSTGPFTKAPPSPTATYPSLWNHDSKKETRIICEPDSQLLVRLGMEEKASIVWATASRPHLNLDFRYTSQPTTVAFTDRESVGGRAWPNVIFSDKQFDFAFTIWSNSTLGLLMHWWHANRQVAGRGTTTVSAAESLPVLDFRALTDDQLATAEAIFNDFRDRELKPAYLADADPNRALLDRRVVCDLLGFDESVYEGVRRLSAKWCAEPSVHGGKARPKNAKLVV